MQLSSYISIISFSAIICFTSRVLSDFKFDYENYIISTEPITGKDFPMIFIFISLLLVFFLIKYLIDSVYNTIDEGTNNIIKR